MTFGMTFPRGIRKFQTARVFLFPPYVLGPLVFPQAHELGVAQVIIGCPFDKLELPDQPRRQPATVRHFRCGEADTPATGMLFR